LDHVIVLGEAHLRRILNSYADYYNSVRTHRSLDKALVNRSFRHASRAGGGGAESGPSFGPGRPPPIY
jgi:hypothetical protein